VRKQGKSCMGEKGDVVLGGRTFRRKKFKKVEDYVEGGWGLKKLEGTASRGIVTSKCVEGVYRDFSVSQYGGVKICLGSKAHKIGEVEVVVQYAKQTKEGRQNRTISFLFECQR